MTRPSSFPANLKRARKARGMTLMKLAEAAGTTHGYLSLLENGQRAMPPGAMLEKIADALAVPLSELVRDDASVPVVGYVGAGAEAHYYATGDGNLGQIDAPPGARPSTVAVEIRGDSLGPLFDGWVAFYDETRTPVTPDLIGQLCVVGLPDGRILIKRLKATADPARFHLLANTEAPLFDQEVSWAARVLTMRPK
ncbi:MAG: helix-turn-helix domain-containing protein [Verrucomicrobia bacterium]|nr:helix-turn-helix domain-containing protein [Verrucomicrobiota bacterium]